MLGSTKSLLATARAYFDELGYNFHTTDDSLDFEKLFDSMVYTINHTKEFSDTREAIKMFRFLDSKFEKIIDAVYKYPDQ